MELAGLTPHLVREEHARGAYVFRRGEAGDALYVVLDGQVAIESPLAGRLALLALCGPGEWFGELAVLTGAPRSADARVELDATLLRVDRTGWTALSLEAPHVFALLCERLSRQLAATNQPRPRARRAVAACEEADGWARELAASLERQFPGRPVHVIGPPARRGEAARALAGIAAPDALVLLVGGAELAPLADRSVRRTGPARFVLTRGRDGRAEDVVKAGDSAAAIDRVARHLAGGVIGLALGAGGAYGLSHLGILRVLDAAEIPVDCVAGTSMGAIVGAAIAAGVPLAALESLTSRVARDYVRLALRDLDLRGPALLRGDAPRRLLEQLEPLAHARCAELAIPFAAVAMDLRSGEAVALHSGSLLDAIQPSYAMPMIFPPCPYGERLLVDGAMASPVPVEAARALGADFVIAAQPIPPLADAPAASPHLVRQALDWLPLGRVRNTLRTLEVSIRSFQSLWHQLARAASAGADAAIEPELAAYSFLQFGAGPEIVAAGGRAAEKALPELRARLSERVGWVAGPRAAAHSASSS